MASKKPIRKPDLKKRLDDIRSQQPPQQPIELVVPLDPALYNMLVHLAVERNQSLADCAAALIAAAMDDSAENRNI